MKRKNFTLVEIMIVVAIIGLLAAIAVPSFLQARTTSRKNACINNLRLIDGAKQQWGMDQNKGDTDTPTFAMLVNTTSLNSSYLRSTPTCRANGSYTVGDLVTTPSCSKSADGHAL